MNNTGADTPYTLPLRREIIRPDKDRTFIIAAVAATHDLLVMNQRPDLAPDYTPARTAVRTRPFAP